MSSRRWTDLDTDAHRLPSGFTRTGYDSNTRRYHFSDAQGRMYQGEPGEEFGGRLTPMGAIDPSMRHRFAPDEQEVEIEAEEKNVVESPRPVPLSPSSFSDFLSSSQMAGAPPSKVPQKQPSNRGSTFSLKRVTTSIMSFRSAKSKRKANTLPSFPSPGANEWGVVSSPQSTKF